MSLVDAGVQLVISEPVTQKDNIPNIVRTLSKFCSSVVAYHPILSGDLRELATPEIKAIGTSSLRILQSKKQKELLQQIALSAKKNSKTVFLTGVPDISMALTARSFGIRYISGEYLGARFLKPAGVRTLTVPEILEDY